jgi:Mor family transcriptional regulator
MNEARDKEIAVKFERGRRLADLAKEYSISKSGIWRIAKKMGCAPCRKPARWRVHTDSIVADYIKGVKTDAIQVQYNMDQRDIYRLLKEQGVRSNRRKLWHAERG